MTEIRKQAICFRATIFTALVAMGFWTLWCLIAGSVPTHGFGAVGLGDAHHTGPVSSRWFDVFLLPVWVLASLNVMLKSTPPPYKKGERELLLVSLFGSLALGAFAIISNVLFTIIWEGRLAAYLLDMSLTSYFMFPVIVSAIAGAIFSGMVLSETRSLSVVLKTCALWALGGSLAFGVLFGMVTGMGGALLLFLSATAGAGLVWALRPLPKLRPQKVIGWLAARDRIEVTEADPAEQSESPLAENEIRKVRRGLQEKLAARDRIKSEIAETEQRLAKLEAELPGGECDAQAIRQEDSRL